MKKSRLLVFVVLVVAPLLVVAWLGYSAYDRDREMRAERFAILARRQLVEIDRLIASHIRDVETELRGYLTASGVSALRETTRDHGIVGRMFVIDPEGVYRFPPEGEPVSAAEAEFLARARALELFSLLSPRTPDARRESAPESGWYTWFMGDGLNFIFWQTGPDGTVSGIELDRSAFISSVVAMLPESNPADTDQYETRVMLSDARGGVLYQWGLYAPESGELPAAEIPLSTPLEAWHLRSFLPSEVQTQSIVAGEYAAIGAGILALVLLVVFLAVFFYREHTKMVRDALQKVSFVNQVSHELKTPLTNIRLYAELLEGRLEGEKERADLGVIIAESTRLGRMINNVLTFARSERRAVEVHLEPVVLDDIVRRVVDSFAPALAGRQIEVRLGCGAPEPVSTDPDLVEQIVSNLVSNVVKYAVVGRRVDITTIQSGSSASITVADYGPGIPPRERRRVFDPFYRMSNSLTDGVSGAGIGLTISKRLAQIIGGSLELVDSSSGAVFRLRIPVDGTTDGAS